MQANHEVIETLAKQSSRTMVPYFTYLVVSKTLHFKIKIKLFLECKYKALWYDTLDIYLYLSRIDTTLLITTIEAISTMGGLIAFLLLFGTPYLPNFTHIESKIRNSCSNKHTKPNPPSCHWESLTRSIMDFMQQVKLPVGYPTR